MKRIEVTAVTQQNEPVRIQLNVEGFGESETQDYEVDRERWDTMTPAERYEDITQAAEGFATNYVNWGWHIADPDDLAATEAPTADLGDVASGRVALPPAGGEQR